ncbi:hypothetical protein TIFTF001_047788 [Ficus carica]|uniref:Uncharacterized protein n=1 Tax=Ficus carica TaxID=3494 RepID=A0AA87YZ14_FICCA|nr:hypothetical protein TIFTF001_047787 [Ficus carica]GMN26223.1 hypothetical protein TIFTF001_047788 [Ficus carica]
MIYYKLIKRASHSLGSFEILHKLCARGTEHRRDEELHLSDAAMEAVACTTSKVVRLPLVQHELETITGALRPVGELLGVAQIAVHEALNVRQQVYAVWIGLAIRVRGPCSGQPDYGTTRLASTRTRHD